MKNESAISKKTYLLLVTIFIMIILAACGESESASGSEDYPEKNINIVVGWGAGGGTDSFTRAISKELEDVLDVKINVENKEGASGSTAGSYVNQQPADGYTIWAVSSNYPITIADDLTKYDLDSFTPIGRVQKDMIGLQTQYEKYDDFDDFAEKAEENPGEITVGGTGSRGFDTLIFNQFEKESGLDVEYVSYEDASAMHADLMGGHIDALLDEIGPTIGQLENEDFEMLLAFSDKKIEGFEDVELSVDKGIDVTDGQSRGLLVKSDVPEPIIDKLESALKEAKDKEGYLEYEEENFLDLREGWSNSKDFQSELKENVELYHSLLNDM